jgi:hypothetical protein
VILGRNALHRINIDWNDLGDLVSARQLPELNAEEAKAYLRHRQTITYSVACGAIA